MSETVELPGPDQPVSFAAHIRPLFRGRDRRAMSWAFDLGSCDDVRAHAELVEVDGHRLIFRVEAFDTSERIGEGTHERIVVDASRLQARADAKRRRELSDEVQLES